MMGAEQFKLMKAHGRVDQHPRAARWSINTLWADALKGRHDLRGPDWTLTET